MNLATQSLKTTSLLAANLWEQLENIESESEIEIAIESLIYNQSGQELVTDTIAYLADEIEAEIVAVEARLKHLSEIHKNALSKLQKWRESLDNSILKLHQQGIISKQINGRERAIKIKTNPPSCEILVEPEKLPRNYQKAVTKIQANKKAITAAWKQGIVIEGTRIIQKQRVCYELIKPLVN